MIREATPDDRPRLRAIGSRSLAQHQPECLEVALAGGGIALVATAAGDTPVGYAVAVAGEDEAYLAELAVAPAHRRRGHGSALLGAAVGRLAGEVSRLVLTVRAGDDRARAFYDHHGFATERRLPGHYEGGDGLVLARSV